MIAESRTGKGFQVRTKKVRQGCGLPDSIKEWVSKHNPYTILKRNSTIKKYLQNYFSDTLKDIDTLSTITHFRLHTSPYSTRVIARRIA